MSALKEGASWLVEAASGQRGAGALAADRLAKALTQLASESQELRKQAESTFLPPLKVILGDLKASLEAQPITLDSLPPDLRDDWVTPDGRARVTIFPKDNPNDSEAMRRFAHAVLAVEPNRQMRAVGERLLEGYPRFQSVAGLWAVLSIAILLWIVLRRFGDVL